MLERILDRFRFSFADVIRRGWSMKFLGHGIDHFSTGRTGEFAQFLHRIAQVPLGDALLFQPDQKSTLRRIFRLNLNHSPARPATTRRETHSTASLWFRSDKFNDSNLV